MPEEKKADLILIPICCTKKEICFYIKDKKDNPVRGLTVNDFEVDIKACAHLANKNDHPYMMNEVMPGLYIVSFQHIAVNMKLSDSAIKEYNIRSVEFKEI